MPGSEVSFLFEVVHLALSRVGSALTSKGLFSRCVRVFCPLIVIFFQAFSFPNVREYLLLIHVSSFWHKTHFVYHILKAQVYTETEYGSL